MATIGKLRVHVSGNDNEGHNAYYSPTARGDVGRGVVYFDSRIAMIRNMVTNNGDCKAAMDRALAIRATRTCWRWEDALAIIAAVGVATGRELDINRNRLPYSVGELIEETFQKSLKK